MTISFFPAPKQQVTADPTTPRSTHSQAYIVADLLPSTQWQGGSRSNHFMVILPLSEVRVLMRGTGTTCHCHPTRPQSDSTLDWHLPGTPNRLHLHVAHSQVLSPQSTSFQVTEVPPTSGSQCLPSPSPAAGHRRPTHLTVMISSFPAIQRQVTEDPTHSSSSSLSAEPGA